MDVDRKPQAQEARICELDALLKAAGIEAPDGQLPGLATDYEQMLVMAAALQSAEDFRSWIQKPRV